jgi:AsmA-like C-terminal region/AsmA family
MSHMSRFYAILKIVLVVGVIGVAIMATYLATFDLNQYKEQLASSLGHSLAEPVQIGNLRYAWLPAPSLDCRDLQIGVPGSGRLQIQTEHLFMKLRFLPLLVGRLEFSEIALQRPEINLPASNSKGEAKISLDQWFEDTRIEKLRLTEAELRFPQRDNQPPATLMLSLSLDNLRSLKSGALSMSGTLINTGAPTTFSLAGKVSFQKNLLDWQTWILDVNGQVTNLRPVELLSLLRLNPPPLFIKNIDQAHIELRGQPASGLGLGILTSGDALVLRGESIKALELPPLELSTRWTVKGTRHQFDALSIRLGRTLLSGSATIDSSGHAGQLGLQLNLDANLAELGMLVPAAKSGSSVEQLRHSVEAGQLSVSANLEIPLSQLTDSAEWLRHLQLHAELSKGRFALGALGQASDLTLVIDARDGRLEITTGHIDWAGSRYTISGELKPPQNDSGELNLTLAGEPDAAKLRELLPADLRETIAIQGIIPTRLNLSGPFDKLILAYQSNVKFLQGQFGSVYLKPAGLKGEIFATGSLRKQVLHIDKAGIAVLPFNVTGSGRLDLDDLSFHAELGLDAIDLQRAQFRSPLLAKLKTRGQFTALCNIDKTRKAPLKLDGRISFDDFGLRLTRVIGDLQGINGSILFTEQDLKTVTLNARLGESPVTIQGGIDSWDQPNIRLHLRGKTVRAHDLIFPSETMLLRDLDGQLKIDRNGIDFESVKVRLDGGTLAHVQGRMESYHSPHVALSISSEFGNIDEVIALWHTEQPRPRKQLPPGHKPPTTEILIKADKGQIGPLSFSDADALLKTDGRGHLVILPLHFHHDAGYGIGHILVDSSQPGPPRLVVSGHVEDFDASAIYRDLLHREGLVSGTTRGDFYLQGEPGGNFLPSSSGGISLQVERGTLYRLPLISKLFSLLNVSQILTLNAPEMAAEGMPFKNIIGAFAMDRGVLSTDNLVIHSNSMDMSLILDQDLKNQTIKGMLAVKPLKTFDNIISSIPLVGWILAGEDKAVLTAHFRVSGPANNPSVTPAPANTIAEPIMGIFVRTLQLPGRMVTNLSDALNAEPVAPGKQ